MRLKIKIGLYSLIGFLPILYYLGNFIKIYANQIVVNYVIMAGAGVLGLLLLMLKRNRGPKQIHFFYGVLLITLFIDILITRNVGPSTALTSVYLIGITWIMLSYQWTEKQGAFAFYIAAALLLIGLAGPSKTRVLSISSNNYISILLILMCCLYYIPFAWNSVKITFVHLLPAILSFVLSVMAEGRGGIMSTGVLIAGMILLFVFSNIDNKRIRALTIVLLVTFLAAVFLLGDRLRLSVFNLGNFQNEGFESTIRTRMWTEYFDETIKSPVRILFGCPLNELSIISKYAGNTHNSFIYLHAIGGIFPLLLFVLYWVKSILYYIKNRSFVLMLLLLTMTVRGMTDKFIFCQYGMPIMVFLVMYPYIVMGQGEQQAK